MLLLKA